MSKPIAQARDASHRLARAVIYCGMMLTGMLTTLLGPLLPVLSARWSLADAQAGYLFTAQFAGSMAGAVLSGLLLPRRGFRFSLVLGFALTASGAFPLGMGSWTVGLLAVFGYGVGLGFTIACTNLWVAENNPERRSSALSVLNFTWGAGAVVCPFLFAVLHSRGNGGTMAPALAAGFVLVALLLAVLRSRNRRRNWRERAHRRRGSARGACALVLCWARYSSFMWERKTRWAVGWHRLPNATARARERYG